MRKIINGKMYDTNTAKELGSDSYSNRRDFNYWCETLYQKRTGEFFLYGEGGPMSRYAKSCGDNSWSGGDDIIPLSVGKARKWAEDHLTASEYEDIFGTPDEGDELVTLHVQLPAALGNKLKIGAAEEKITIREYVERLLTEATK